MSTTGENASKVGTNPLMVLRHFVSKKKEIGETEDQFVFGDIAYYKNAKTNFPIFKTGKEGSAASTSANEFLDNKREYYTLESLKYLLDNASLQHAMYVKKTVQLQSTQSEGSKMQVVTRVDRGPLLDYLEGRTSKCNGDHSGPIELPMPAPIKTKKDKQISSSASSSSAFKKTLSAHSSSSISGTVNMLLTSQSNRENVLNAIKLPEAGQLFYPTCLKIKVEPGIVKQEKHDGGGGSSSTSRDRNSILAAIGPAKILELKTKRRAIKAHEVSSVREDVDFALSAPGSGPMTKDQEDAITIMSHERVYADRNSILKTQHRSFLSSVSSILHSLKHKEDRLKKFGPGLGKDKDSPVSSRSVRKPALPPPPKKYDPSAPYSRYDQKDTGCLETAEFGIKNPLQSFSLSFVEGVKTTLQEKKKATPPPAKKMRRELTPIIIVPDCPPSLLTILNAKDFLEDSVFNTQETKKAAGCKKTNEVLIHRPKFGVMGKTVPYKVVCYPDKLQLSDWDRVVAVFITGKTWQFKGWPFNASPVEICTKYNAYYLKYEDMEPDANVKQWPVRLIQVGRHRRHLDKAAVIGFWSTVESFIQKTKPYLQY